MVPRWCLIVYQAAGNLLMLPLVMQQRNYLSHSFTSGLALDFADYK